MTKTFITLDRVLANFDDAALDLKAKHPEIVDRESFWKVANSSLFFWESIKPNENGIKMFNALKSFNPIILTSIPDISTSDVYQARRAWVNCYLGEGVPMFAGQQGFKHLFCSDGDRISIMTDKQSMRLENWYRFGNVMHGNIYNNPNFDDGKIVSTSKIISVKGNVLTTKNSIYILGDAHE